MTGLIDGNNSEQRLHIKRRHYIFIIREIMMIYIYIFISSIYNIFVLCVFNIMSIIYNLLFVEWNNVRHVHRPSVAFFMNNVNGNNPDWKVWRQLFRGSLDIMGAMIEDLPDTIWYYCLDVWVVSVGCLICPPWCREVIESRTIVGLIAAELLHGNRKVHGHRYECFSI